jgi:hypothetical protein
MYKPSTYLIVTYFPIYLSIYDTYFLHHWLPTGNQILAQLRFIHNWVIMGIQWMVRCWVPVHYDLWQHHVCEKPAKWTLRFLKAHKVDTLIIEHFGTSFSILLLLNDLKCYKSTFSSSTNHLPNAKPKERQKRAVKKISFFKLQNTFFFIFFHFDPSYFISA